MPARRKVREASISSPQVVGTATSCWANSRRLYRMPLALAAKGRPLCSPGWYVPRVSSTSWMPGAMSQASGAAAKSCQTPDEAISPNVKLPLSETTSGMSPRTRRVRIAVSKAGTLFWTTRMPGCSASNWSIRRWKVATASGLNWKNSRVTRPSEPPMRPHPLVRAAVAAADSPVVRSPLREIMRALLLRSVSGAGDAAPLDAGLPRGEGVGAGERRGVREVAEQRLAVLPAGRDVERRGFTREVAEDQQLRAAVR